MKKQEENQEPQTKTMWFFNGKPSDMKPGATFYLQLRKVVQSVEGNSTASYTCAETAEDVLCFVQKQFPEYTWGLGVGEKTTLTALTAY